MDDLPENCHSLNLSDLSVWVWGLTVAFYSCRGVRPWSYHELPSALFVSI